jgi:hypothetical protein
VQYIAEAQGLWYEGSAAWLRLMQGHPIMLPFKIRSSPGHECYVFLEDYFNSATRIRRGRLFQKDARNSWEASTVSRFPNKDLQNFAGQFNVNRAYKVADVALKVGCEIILGDNNAESIWCIVLAEKTGLDGYYITIKSKTFLGVLPEIDSDKIPESNRNDILMAIDAVVESAPMQSPQSVIDACRNAASHIISAKFPASNPKGKKDLGGLVTWLINQGRLKSCVDAADAVLYLLEAETSHLVNMLHSRGKANAAAIHGTRPVSRRDADLAVNAVAFLLQDFGWAANE